MMQTPSDRYNYESAMKYAHPDYWTKGLPFTDQIEDRSMHSDAIRELITQGNYEDLRTSLDWAKKMPCGNNRLLKAEHDQVVRTIAKYALTSGKPNIPLAKECLEELKITGEKNALGRLIKEAESKQGKG